ncbi:MAG TPA: ABC transporter substrate-binding protein [Chloroflexota bacterium]|nr:ABC transporter substrate-binding protein [Chloroflexota bacterium]
MKRIIIPTLLLLAATAIGRGGAPAPTPALAAHPPASVVAQAVPVRVGTVAGANTVALHYAGEQGWFQAEGLNVLPVALPGTAEVLLALVGGSLDLGPTQPFAHLWLHDQGADLRIVAAGAVEERGRPVHALLVRANSPLQAARDLEGTQVGISASHTGDRLMLQAWLDRQGVERGRVTLVELPESVHVRALLEGAVDAVSAVEPFVSGALGRGTRVLAHHYTDTNASTLLSYYVATAAWLDGHADVARRFARALHRANAALEADPALKQQVVARRLGIATDLAGRMGHAALPTRVDPAALQWWSDTGRRLGLLRSPLTAADPVFDSAR